jgi:hypothetical protein
MVTYKTKACLMLDHPGQLDVALQPDFATAAPLTLEARQAAAAAIGAMFDHISTLKPFDVQLIYGVPIGARGTFLQV